MKLSNIVARTECQVRVKLIWHMTSEMSDDRMRMKNWQYSSDASQRGCRMEEMMNKGLKKAAVFGLSAVLAMSSLAGCSKKEEKTFDAAQTAVTINGTEISAGTVKFMTHYMQAATESFYDQYFGAGSMNMAIDENGTTLGEMMKEQNIASLTSMVLMEQHMEEYGVALTEEEKAAISEAAAAFLADNDEEVLTKMGATQEDVERYLELNTIQVKMTPAMSADVDTEVSDEEAAQRRIQYALFTAETEGESEEETEAVSEAETTGETEEETVAETAAETAEETEAETAAETAEETEAETAGETESETAAETTEESESETAALEENETTKTKSAAETESEEVTEAAESESETETETEDPAMVAAMEEAYAKAEQAIALIKDGGDFEESIKSIDEDLTVRDLTFGSDSTSVVAALVTATEGVADDTLIEVPVEGSTGYYVVKVVTQLDREATDTKKETIVEERKSERVTELLTEWQEAAEVTQDDEVLAQIVFDFSLALEEETETENVTEAASETESESETAAETESESETAAATESESETAAVSEAESESETEAESETAAAAESESETEAASETESETEA